MIGALDFIKTWSRITLNAQFLTASDALYVDYGYVCKWAV